MQEVDDVGRPRRQLLQENEGELDEVQEEVGEEEVITTTTTTTEEPFDAADQAGPTKFYREYGNLPKFLMEVDNGKRYFYYVGESAFCINALTGMELTLYKEGNKIDTFVLDMKADGGITGSKLSNPMEDEMEPEEPVIRKEDFKVDIFLYHIFSNLYLMHFNFS